MSKVVYLSASTQANNIGTDGISEKTRMRELLGKVAYYIAKGLGDVVVHSNINCSSLQQSIDDSNSKNPDIHLALHSNAGGGRGTEIYYSNYPSYSPDGYRLAKIIYDLIAPITIANDRGIHADTDWGSTGLAETRDTTAIAALIEIFFHDNIDDINDYELNEELIAINLARAVYEYFGMSYYIEPVIVTPPVVELTEKEKVITYVDSQNGWDMLFRMFNL